jgi:hypothetical protein
MKLRMAKITNASACKNAVVKIIEDLTSLAR